MHQAAGRPLLEWTALVGLGVVFLVNAFVAVVQPEEFERLVADSAFDGLSDIGWLAGLIALNDLLVGIALIATVSLARYRFHALAWAGAWLLAVSAIKLTTLA